MATGAIISAAAGLVAAAATTTTAVVTNKKTNEANRRLQEEMNQYNKEQTDPAYIRERQEAAGYNSQLLANPNTLGQVATQNSYIPHQPADAATISSGFVQALSSAVGISQAIQENKMKAAQTQQINIENEFKMQQGLAQIQQMLASARDSRSKAALNEIMSRYQDKILNNQVQMSAEQINLIKEQAKSQVMENVMTDVRMKSFPDAMRLEIANAAAQLAVQRSVERLNKQQLEHEIHKMAETIARTSLYQEQLNTQVQTTSSAQSQAEVSRRTIEEQVSIIRNSMWKAIMNSGSDSPFQYIQSLGRGSDFPVSTDSHGNTLIPYSHGHPLSPH